MIYCRALALLFLSTLLLTQYAATARGDVVSPYHENLDGWLTDTTDQHSITFDIGRDLLYGDYEPFASTAGLTLTATGALPTEQVQFVGLYYDALGNANPSLYLVNPDNASNKYWNSGVMLQGPAYRPGTEAKIQVTLPAGGVNAIGFDLRSVDDSAQDFKIVLYKDASFTQFFTATPVSTMDPGAALVHSFWGATSATPITRIDVILLSGRATIETQPIIDNFRYASIATGGTIPLPTSVPEPATGFVYLVIGIAGLTVARFRSSRR